MTAKTSDISASNRGGGWAAFSVLLVLGGPIAYGLLFGIPAMRSTGAPAFASISAGVAAGIVAVLRDRRMWVRIVCAGDIAALAIGIFLFFGFATLPNATAVTRSDSAPDFTLSNHKGEQVRLYDLLDDGPVLLVFYRGHW
jgi:cytochrome oxidase Cu insertion factor (SCO1/SenC/PrrC family)